MRRVDAVGKLVVSSAGALVCSAAKMKRQHLQPNYHNGRYLQLKCHTCRHGKKPQRSLSTAAAVAAIQRPQYHHHHRQHQLPTRSSPYCRMHHNPLAIKSWRPHHQRSTKQPDGEHAACQPKRVTKLWPEKDQASTKTRAERRAVTKINVPSPDISPNPARDQNEYES